MDKEEALIAAQRRQVSSGRQWYVVYAPLDKVYLITDRMPLCGGEWYTTDGIRHG